MEPWQQEELRQLQVLRQARHKPRCSCCQETVETELQLDLAPFGLPAVACERCVNKHLKETV